MRSRSAPAVTLTCSCIRPAPGACWWSSAKTRPRACSVLVLGINTSGRQGGIALVHVGRLLSASAVAGGTFSAELIPQIAAMLEQHGLSKDHLGGIGVISGPGSFTGLRVGLAAVKGPRVNQ